MKIWEKMSQSPYNIKVDIVNKNLTIDNIKVIEKGGVKNGYELNTSKQSLISTLNEIEWHYKWYKYSIPSKKSDSKLFKALTIEEIPMDMLIKARSRNETRAWLEYYILESILNGNLYWDDAIMGGKWYWKSKNDPDLVILKEWL